MRRRDVLVISAVLGAAAAIPPILRRLPSEFTFEPLPEFDGFRRLQGGAVSGGIDPFFGLSEAQPDPATLRDARLKDPCSALFGPEGWRPGTVPVAIFTDINCPYCKVLEQQLIDMRASDGTIDLIWHEMPLLGPSSVRAARAILAARTFGAEHRARAYLATHPFPPGSVGLTRLAEAVELPPNRLVQAEASETVSRMLSESLTLGRRLGIYGTPGTVVGRTLVIGAIRPPDLRKLIALEASEPQSVCA